MEPNLFHPIDLDARSTSTLDRFLAGIRFALVGVRVVVVRPLLWGYLFAPITILVTLFAVMALVSWTSIGWLFSSLTTLEPGSSVWMPWFWTTIGLLVRALALFVLGVVLYFIAGLVATPFNDRLSAQIEQMMFGCYEEPFSWRVMWGDLANSLSHTVLSLLLWLSVMTFAFLLNVVPMVGSVVSFLLAAFATAIFLGRESMDGCMSRRRMSYRHKHRVLSTHFPLVMGFGLTAAVMLWIPFLNFLMLPMAVVGGTLMYCELERQGLVPDSAGNPGYRSPRATVRQLPDNDTPADATLESRPAVAVPLSRRS